ncbi:hypothetical protein SAMN05421690_101340 [Nitrosomonas sp. Nm51]|nr:hypothetical protein SAMN05421690_101340 [Nitrosomonas sp. Nm51]
MPRPSGLFFEQNYRRFRALNMLRHVLRHKNLILLSEKQTELYVNMTHSWNMTSLLTYKKTDYSNAKRISVNTSAR